VVTWLASYPRSGNTLFRLALHHLYGTRTGSIYRDPVLVGIGAAATVGHQAGPAPLEAWLADSDRHIVKTHELPSDELPAIYIARDGRDVLVSHASYIDEFGIDLPAGLLFDGPDRVEQILRWLVTSGHPAYGLWSDHVLAWHARRPMPAVVRYEELASNPGGAVGQALERLGQPISSGAGRMPTFEDLHQLWPGFFRQGAVGSWTTVMTSAVETLFWRYHRPAMELLGYE
jgi:hypothetical protein